MRALSIFILFLTSGVLASRVAVAAPKSAATQASIRARWQTRKELRTWAAPVRGRLLTGFGKTEGGQMASAVFALEPQTGSQVVVRRASDVREAVQLHNALGKLAAEMNAGDLVEPAIRAQPNAAQTELAGAHDVMITRRTPAGFLSADHAPQAWLDKVPEATRLRGALLDALSNQQDRLKKNLLIREDGSVRLIDHDSSFGHGPQWANPSVFSPGQPIAYSTPQPSFAALPGELHALVDDIAHAKASRLALRYGLDLDTARYLRASARLVRDRGLTGAIDKLRRAGKDFKGTSP